MRTRKPTEAEYIASIKVELENRTKDLERLIAKYETEGWTPIEKERADEHVAFIEKNVPKVKAFYRPAMVI